MKLRIWGVRGRVPVSGERFMRHGGNTPCVEVQGAAGETVVLDAGTGIVPLGRALMAREFGRGAGSLTLLLSHCHPDHLLGLPFFAPIYQGGNTLRIRGIRRSDPPLDDILEGLLDPHYSPLFSLKNLKAQFDVQTWDGSPLREGSLELQAWPVPHGNAFSSVLLVREGQTTAAYLPDVGYPDDPSLEAFADRLAGVHTLVHDAMFPPSRREKAAAHGHSTWLDAAKVARRAKVRRLVLFHYDPDAEDSEIEGLAAQAADWLQSRGCSLEVRAAREDDLLEVG